eukprot:3700317-Prorocentrum_lima.AAC.1
MVLGRSGAKGVGRTPSPKLLKRKVTFTRSGAKGVGRSIRFRIQRGRRRKKGGLQHRLEPKTAV